MVVGRPPNLNKKDREKYDKELDSLITIRGAYLGSIIDIEELIDSIIIKRLLPKNSKFKTIFREKFLFT